MRAAAAITPILAVMTALASMALAQEGPGRPMVQPTRDVTVAYTVSGAAADAIPGGVDGPLRLSWDAKGQRLRVDAGSRPQAVILDLAKRSATLLDSALRAAVPLPVRDRDLQSLALGGARMTRRGQDSVAGLACINWDVQAPKRAGTVCLTPDGVVLRGEGDVNGRHGSFAASSVRYGAVAPDLFAVPPGYLSLSFPRPGH